MYQGADILFYTMPITILLIVIVILLVKINNKLDK